MNWFLKHKRKTHTIRIKRRKGYYSWRKRRGSFYPTTEAQMYMGYNPNYRYVNYYGNGKWRSSH